MIGGEIAENERDDRDFADNETVTLRTESGATVRAELVDTFERDGQLCREYILRSDDRAAPREQRAVACQTGPDRWRLASAD
jgi:hypothetical protein